MEMVNRHLQGYHHEGLQIFGIWQEYHKRNRKNQGSKYCSQSMSLKGNLQSLFRKGPCLLCKHHIHVTTRCHFLQKARRDLLRLSRILLRSFMRTGSEYENLHLRFDSKACFSSSILWTLLPSSGTSDWFCDTIQHRVCLSSASCANLVYFGAVRRHQKMRFRCFYYVDTSLCAIENDRQCHGNIDYLARLPFGQF